MAKRYGYQDDLADILEGIDDLAADLEDIRDEAQDLFEENGEAQVRDDLARMDEAIRLLARAAELIDRQ